MMMMMNRMQHIGNYTEQWELTEDKAYKPAHEIKDAAD